MIRNKDIYSKRRPIYALAALMGGSAGFILVFMEPSSDAFTPATIFLSICWFILAITLWFTKIPISKIENISFSILTLQFISTDLIPLHFKNNLQEIYQEVLKEDSFVLIILMSFSLIFFKAKTAISWNLSLVILSIIYTTIRVSHFYSLGDTSVAPYNWYHLILLFSLSAIFVHILAYFKEIANKVQLEAELVKQLAYKDELTNLPNRRAMREMLELEFKQAKEIPHPLCIALIDIDNFKRINDTYGHVFGDKIIQELAEIIKKHTRLSDYQDSLFGRWGGEEFLYILPRVSLQYAYEISERLRKAISNHSFHGNLNVTISFGITGLSQQDNLEGVLDRADEALYMSKTTGRNRVSTLGIESAITG